VDLQIFITGVLLLFTIAGSIIYLIETNKSIKEKVTHNTEKFIQNEDRD